MLERRMVHEMKAAVGLYLGKISTKVRFLVITVILIFFSYLRIKHGEFKSFELRVRLNDSTLTGNETISTQQSEIFFVPEKSLRICKPERSLVYVKTHKTGSSSVLGVIMRHLIRNKIFDKVLRFPAPFFGGYPGPFKKEFCFVNSFRNICSDLVKAPAAIVGHFRFDEIEVKALMKPETKYITVMRNPMQSFESAFHFFYGRIHNHKFPITCDGMPYLKVLNRSGMNYSDYLAAVSKEKLVTAPWGFRSKSYQSFDLGLDPQNEEEEYILNQARKLDRVFGLVLIIDYFMESLILLRDLLCMEWEDIIPLHEKNTLYEPHNYSEKEVITVKSLLKQDILLYDYFNATLWRKVEKYGRERMTKDLEILRFFINKQRENDEVSAVREQKIQETEKYRFSKPFESSQNLFSERRNLLVNRLLHSVGGDKINLFHIHQIADYMEQHNGWCPY